MKKATMKKKLCCYLICAVMAATGACTTSYALEGDGQSQGQANETPVVTEEMTQAPEGEATEVAPEEDITEPEQQETDAVSEEDAVVEEEQAESGKTLMTNNAPVIKGLKVSFKASTGKVTLNWTDVEGAVRYEIGLTQDEVFTKYADSTTSNGSFVLEGVAYKTYPITVAAYDAEGETANLVGYINRDVFLKKTTPSKPRIKGLKTMKKAYDSKSAKLSINKQRSNSYKNKTIVVEPDFTLKWNACKGAKSYSIYKYTCNSKGKINLKSQVCIAKGIKKTSYHRVEKVTDKCYNDDKYGYYWYKVVAVYPGDINTTRTSAASTRLKMPKFLNVSGLSQTGEKTGRNSICTYRFYCKTNTSAKFYKQGSGQAYKRWIPKGVKGWTNGGSGSKFELKGSKYGTGYVMRHKMTAYAVDYSPYIDWTKSRKETYVNNSSKFNGGGKYVIWVSRYTQNINVFKKVNGKYKLVRVCECATGKFRNYSASGTFKIHKRIKHRIRSKYHYYYLNCYNGINSLHGPTYWKSNSKPKSLPYAHLGKNGMSNGTLGCVRTWNADAYYIWQNCPMKTKVVVY